LNPGRIFYVNAYSDKNYIFNRLEERERRRIMTAKNVYQWLLTKLDDETILDIYSSSKGKIVCRGFRTNNVHDVKTNRKNLIINLLSPGSYKYLKSWFTKIDVFPENHNESIVDKEVEELLSIADKEGIVSVFIRLLNQNLDKKAVQLFGEITNHSNHLLEVKNQAFSKYGTENASDKNAEKRESILDSKKLETESHSIQDKNEDKITKKIERKLKNLESELEKRTEQYTKKIEHMERKNKETVDSLNNKLAAVHRVVKEKDDQIKDLELALQKSKNSEQEKDRLIDSLQKQIEDLRKQMNELEEILPKKEKSIHILVVGQPASEVPFKNETIQFTFLENELVYDFQFNDSYDSYWVLGYELSNKEQYLLRQNDSFNQLRESKIKICKQFSDVQMLMKIFEKTKVGAL
jgi:DNA repair exonuclease SbcCD ATPase subunit